MATSHPQQSSSLKFDRFFLRARCALLVHRGFLGSMIMIQLARRGEEVLSADVERRRGVKVST